MKLTLSNIYKALFLAYMGIMSIGMNATPHMWLGALKLLLLLGLIFVIIVPLYTILGGIFFYLAAQLIIKSGKDPEGRFQKLLDEAPDFLKHQYQEIKDFFSKLKNKVL